MILLVILQLFTSEIDSSISASRNAQHDVAYRIAHSIPLDSLEGFEYYEVLELQGLMSLRTHRFNKAKEIYKEVIKCDFDSILYKAYINYADVHYYTFDFQKRIKYLQEAYIIDPTPKVIRNISRYYFQIEADYETAQQWIDKHPIPIDPKEQAGFNLLMAEFNESKRQYKQAIDYYSKSKISAQKADLFSYELFAAEVLHRAQRLESQKSEEKMINWITWFILGVIIYYYVKKIKVNYVRVDQPQNQGSNLNY